MFYVSSVLENSSNIFFCITKKILLLQCEAETVAVVLYSTLLPRLYRAIPVRSFKEIGSLIASGLGHLARFKTLTRFKIGCLDMREFFARVLLLHTDHLIPKPPPATWEHAASS